MSAPTPVARWVDAVGVVPHGDGWRGDVAPGWDVFGIPHGGYLMGQAANAALAASGAPDILSITTHFVRRAAFGTMDFTVARVGGSRRFTSLQVIGRQGGEEVTVTLALLADRDDFSGQRWSTRQAPVLPDDALLPRADVEAEPEGPDGRPAKVTLPAISMRLGVRLVREDAGFTTGVPNGSGIVRVVAHPAEAVPPGQEQVLALIAADVTPPAVWNALGITGWVPTVELSAQLRARPATGPMAVVARCTEVGDGFVDEEAEVYDAHGRLVLHALQHARVSERR